MYRLALHASAGNVRSEVASRVFSDIRGRMAKTLELREHDWRPKHHGRHVDVVQLGICRSVGIRVRGGDWGRLASTSSLEQH